jgi:hypothetical protein
MATSLRVVSADDTHVRFRFVAASAGGAGRLLTVREGLRAIDLLREAVTQLEPWKAVFFEMPPVTASTLDTQSFEAVIMPAHALVGAVADQDAFAYYTNGASTGGTDGAASTSAVVVFDNKSGDARLVVPRKLEGQQSDIYAHLHSFLANAPSSQTCELWSTLEKEIERSDGRVWVSTSGLGVAWLHMRLDKTPKYYKFSAFRRM